MYAATHVELTSTGLDVTVDVGPRTAGLIIDQFQKQKFNAFAIGGRDLWIEKLTAGDGKFVASLQADKRVARGIADSFHDDTLYMKPSRVQ